MRAVLVTLMLLASGTAQASGMTAVARDTGFCQDRTESYCFEWRLAGDHALRFIALGDEDIIDYSFYRVGADGQYNLQASVHPVLKDDTHPGQLFWAYPWDISDIALAPGKSQPILLATFDHSIAVTGAEGDAISTTKLPAVLFLGHTTQPQVTVPMLRFSATPMSGLAGKRLTLRSIGHARAGPAAAPFHCCLRGASSRPPLI